MKIKKILCLASALLIMTAVLCACKGNDQQGNAETNEAQEQQLKNFDGNIDINGITYPNENTTTIQASLYKDYNNIGEMKNDVENIVYVEVIEDETPETSDTAPVVYTPNKVKILKAYKGSLKKDDIIKVYETGEHLESGMETGLEGVPLLKAGSKAVLFLKQGEAGQYWTISGPYGKYILDSNSLVHNSFELSSTTKNKGITEFNTKALKDNASFQSKSKSGANLNTKPGVTLSAFEAELDTHK